MNTFKNFLKNKKILITGASGVIGYNLCQKLADICLLKIHINCLRDINENYFNSDYFIPWIFDITDKDKTNQLPQFDIIFHCSGYGQPQKFVENPEKTLAINTSVVSNLLEKVNPNGTFIFISSSEIYANSTGNKETDKIIIDSQNKRNCYILGKLFGETLLNITERNITSRSIRLCLGYGPGYKKGDKRVLYEFIDKALNNNIIDLIDNGSDLRSYIYVDDCINAILNIAQSGKEKIYNIGGKEVITILDLANKISKITGCDVKIGNKKNKIIDSPSKAFVDISRYENEFGQLNNINIYDGLIKTIEWHKSL